MTLLQGLARAVQFSLSDTVCQRIVEVERVDIEFAGDVFDTVGAQDVDREASEAGEVCRLDAGLAGVFAEGDVADIMAAVVSRPEGFHLRPLSERCGSLSTHTAPIKQTRL